MNGHYCLTSSLVLGIFFTLLPPPSALAQAVNQANLNFAPEVQIRPRWEADSGRDGDPDAGDVSYVSMRARLGGTLSYGDASGRVVISDVRMFGTEDDTRRDFSAEGLDVRIATLRYSPGPLTLVVGRMETSLLNERLLAKANWRQPGRSFDGAYLQFQAGHFILESWGLIISEGDVATFDSSDQVVPQGEDASFTALSPGYRWKRALLRPLVIYDVAGDSDLQRVTYGARGQALLGPVELAMEAYGQGGQSGNETLAGAMAHASATYRPAVRYDPTFALWYDWLRGDDDPDDGRLTTFNTLYGANHKFYGNIDMAVFQLGGFQDAFGLQDAAFKANISPRDRLKLGLDLHAFFAAQPSNKSLLAIEPDASFSIALQPGLSLTGGVNLWLPPSGPEAREWMSWLALDLKLP